MEDSRRFPRKKLEGRVELLTNGGTFLGNLRDISEGGFGMVTSTPCQVGYEMFVSVQLAGAIESLSALAEVVWINPLEAAFHPTGMGLRFLALTTEDFYKLERILELT
jgi:Tfp pilus assembly protein PilZ